MVNIVDSYFSLYGLKEKRRDKSLSLKNIFYYGL